MRYRFQKKRVCLDAKTRARLLHRYLAEVHFEKYDGNPEARVVFKKSFYQIQWQNVLSDLKRSVSPAIIFPRLAYTFAFLLALKLGNVERALGYALIGAVTFDAVSTGSADPTSVTFSHTTTTSADRFILGGIHTFANGSEAGSHTSYSYAGAALTGIVNAVKNNSNGMVSLWGRTAPATGANNCVASGISGYAIWAMAITFYDVNQTTSYSGNTSTTGNSSGPSLAVTSTVGAIVADYMCHTDGTTTPTVGADQTSRFSHAGNPRGNGSTEAGAASVTMSWTLDATRQWSYAAVSVDPPVAAVFPEIMGTANQGRYPYLRTVKAY